MKPLEIGTAIDGLSEPLFEQLKYVTAAYRAELGDMTGSHAARMMFAVLCEDNLLSQLTRAQLTKLLGGLFFNALRDEQWEAHYMEAAANAAACGSRTRYAAIRQHFVDPVREGGAYYENRTQEEVLDDLQKYLANLLVLYRQEKATEAGPAEIRAFAEDIFLQPGAEAAQELDGMDVTAVTRGSAEERLRAVSGLLSAAAKDTAARAKTAAGTKLAELDRNSERKWFAVMLTWLLFCRMKDNEGNQ